MIRDNKRGILRIKIDVINDDPKLVRKVMGKIIVVRAECMDFGQEIEYQAISPLFDKLKEGEIIPEYWVEITKPRNKIAFKRIK